jgi:hypothetical protein
MSNLWLINFQQHAKVNAQRRAKAISAFSFLVLLLVPESPVHAQTCPDSDEPFGSLVDAAEFAASVQALPPAAFFTPPDQPALPSRAFLTNLPAVSQQGTAGMPGSPGTCEAQSFGYGLGSYTAARLPDGSPKWNPALPQNSVSPAYLFALALSQGPTVATCPKGGLALEYLAQLVAFGAPTRARVPYQPNCPYLEGIENQTDFPESYPAMQRFRIGSYATFQIHDSAEAVQMIKEYIANGQAVAFSGSVLCGYGTNLQLQDGVIYETSTTMAGHGQLVVGYDDTVGTRGNTGALLVQNSFGTGWPASAGAGSSPAPPGMVYWSYNTFETTQKLAAVAYPRSPGPPAGVRLSSSIGAPLASITRAFQWEPNDQQTFLILTHFFHDPVMLGKVVLTEPGAKGVTATADYGQYISTGYSYLTRTDGNAFRSGAWAVTLEGTDVSGNPVTYRGTVMVGVPQPNDTLPAASMAVAEAAKKIFGSTGKAPAFSP